MIEGFIAGLAIGLVVGVWCGVWLARRPNPRIYPDSPTSRELFEDYRIWQAPAGEIIAAKRVKRQAEAVAKLHATEWLHP